MSKTQYGLILKQDIPSPYSGKFFYYEDLKKIAVSMGLSDNNENLEEFFKKKNYFITVRTDKNANT